MPKCAACSAEVPATSRFCPDCGVATQSSRPVMATAAATEAMPPRRSSQSSGSLTNSGAVDFDEGRFLPGTLLAERYRILGCVGKGGMGEVYRANDLRLGQSVALKFLPEHMSQDPAILARFYSEVRIARQITHPNVCRVYDIGDVEGQPFISMQFVDGETLASLLLRIGRLPADKAIDITRRLCAGLAAAHSQGVLHRDLKPANIMIDGRGQVLIMDFGLAGVAEQIEGSDIRSGTPAYMSPEQLAGREVSTRSDLYALGLVMYEIFTGKRPFDAGTLAELVRLREESRPAEISSLARDVDPAVERIILRCLDPDPASRPGSAFLVSSAMPGGDPLAMALAAGETPSPEMVAAAGSQEAMRPLWAILTLSFILVALVVLLVATSKQSFVARVRFEVPPEAMAVQARKMIQQLGYTAPPDDHAWGFDYNVKYLNFVRDHAKPPIDWSAAINGQPSAILFSYRQSPGPLQAQNINGIVGRPTYTDPPQTTPGMATVQMDLTGHLLSFSVVPIKSNESVPAPADPATLFGLAGLDFKTFKPDTLRSIPAVATDNTAAWTGFFPGHPDYPIRVEAAWWRGQPVFFKITEAADVSTPSSGPSAEQQVQRVISVTGMFMFLVVAPLFAWRNLRLGRGDRQGALRLGVFAFSLGLIAWMLSTHHVSTIWEFGLITTATALALLTAAQLWVSYLALEPAVRRRWPRILITWTRVLTGRWRDALVGRDVLIGIAVGVGYDLAFCASRAYYIHNGARPPGFTDLASLYGFQMDVSMILRQMISSLAFALVFFLLFFVLRLVARKEWLAGVIFVLVFSLSRGLASDYQLVATVLYLVVYGLIVTVLLRFGLLALVTALFVTDLLPTILLTPNFTAWYGTASLMVLVVVIALALVAFRQALGGRRLLAPLLDE